MCGAFISWIILFIMLAYSGYRLYFMVNRMNPTITRTTLIKTPDEDVPFRPQDTGFDFAFSLTDRLDPSIGHFTVRYIN